MIIDNDFIEKFCKEYYNYCLVKAPNKNDLQKLIIDMLNDNEETQHAMVSHFINFICENKYLPKMSYISFKELLEHIDDINIYVLYLLLKT